MSVPRRRLVRPPDPVPDTANHQRRLDRLHACLLRERAALKRWQKRFKRAYTAIDKHQAAIVRMERQISPLAAS